MKCKVIIQIKKQVHTVFFRSERRERERQRERERARPRPRARPRVRASPRNRNVTKSARERSRVSERAGQKSDIHGIDAALSFWGAVLPQC